jgi:hypothetical protein
MPNVTRRRRRQARPPKSPRSPVTFGQAVAGVQRLEWVALAVTVTVTVWAWLAYVVEYPQDFDGFILVFAIATIVGATLQVILIVYVRPSGSLRQRLAFGARAGAQGGAWIPLLGPAVIIGLALLILTPPGTSVEDFDSGMSLYQVIPLMALLALLGTAIGAGVVFLLVVMPLGFLVAALLPGDERIAPSDPLPLTRSQLALAGLFLLCLLGFGVAMVSVYPDATGRRAERMWESLVALLTATGEPIPSALAWFFALSIVLIVILSNRVEASLRRQRPVHRPHERPADSPEPGEDTAR